MVVGIGQSASVPRRISLAGRCLNRRGLCSLETLSNDRSDLEVRMNDLIVHPYSLHSHRPYTFSSYLLEDVAVPLRGPA